MLWWKWMVSSHIDGRSWQDPAEKIEWWRIHPTSGKADVKINDCVENDDGGSIYLSEILRRRDRGSARMKLWCQYFLNFSSDTEVRCEEGTGIETENSWHQSTVHQSSVVSANWWIRWKIRTCKANRYTDTWGRRGERKRCEDTKNFCMRIQYLTE